MITLGYSRQSKPSALKIAEASDGQIVAVQGRADINWGRRRATSAALNPDNENAVNKRAMRELFREHGVPAPQLYTPAEAQAAFLIPENAPVKLIGRPDYHTRGRGLWLCESFDEVCNAMVMPRPRLRATHFMDFVDLPQEFRVHIFQGKSIRISEKKRIDGDGNDYTTIKPTLPKKHIRRAAKAAVKALGLDFGAVDVLADETRAMVLEVNSAPGLGGSMPRLYADTFIKWAAEREAS